MDRKRLEALKKQPLHAAAMGIVEGTCLVARANYVRVEVRDEQGALRFAYDVGADEHWILREMLLAGRHLVVAVGDLAPCGLRVWDLAHARETLRFEDVWLDEGDMVLWSDATAPHALVRTPDGISMLDVSVPATAWSAPLEGEPDAIAYDVVHDRLALGSGWDDAALTVRERNGGTVSSCPLESGSVEQLRFAGRGRFLAVTQANRPVVIRATEDLAVRWEGASAGVLAASPCGRWLALSDALVDLEAMTATSMAAADRAVFDSDAHALVLADRARSWRVPLP